MQTSHPLYDRIVSDPGILNGQPCVRGHRLTIKRVLKLLSEHAGEFAQIKQDFNLEPEDLRQVLAFAADTADDLSLFGGQTS